jgi:hypothetical protein
MGCEEKDSKLGDERQHEKEKNGACGEPEPTHGGLGEGR